MKKTYKKPVAIIENFTLNTSIAGDCGIKTYTPNSGTCGIEQEGLGTVFMTGMAGCSFQVSVDDGSYNGFCYHVPIDDNKLFNS